MMSDNFKTNLIGSENSEPLNPAVSVAVNEIESRNVDASCFTHVEQSGNSNTSKNSACKDSSIGETILTSTVQCESISESTLESEIDALAKIITDAKGESEIYAKEEKSAANPTIAEENRNISEFKEKKTDVESGQNISINVADEKLTSNKNNSLKMIGEAYISEDSQESDECLETVSQSDPIRALLKSESETNDKMKLEQNEVINDFKIDNSPNDDFSEISVVDNVNINIGTSDFSDKINEQENLSFSESEKVIETISKDINFVEKCGEFVENITLTNITTTDKIIELKECEKNIKVFPERNIENDNIDSSKEKLKILENSVNLKQSSDLKNTVIESDDQINVNDTQDYLEKPVIPSMQVDENNESFSNISINVNDNRENRIEKMDNKSIDSNEKNIPLDIVSSSSSKDDLNLNSHKIDNLDTSTRLSEEIETVTSTFVTEIISQNLITKACNEETSVVNEPIKILNSSEEIAPNNTNLSEAIHENMLQESLNILEKAIDSANCSDLENKNVSDISIPENIIDEKNTNFSKMKVSVSKTLITEFSENSETKAEISIDNTKKEKSSEKLEHTQNFSDILENMECTEEMTVLNPLVCITDVKIVSGSEDSIENKVEKTKKVKDDSLTFNVLSDNDELVNAISKSKCNDEFKENNAETVENIEKNIIKIESTEEISSTSECVRKETKQKETKNCLLKNKTPSESIDNACSIEDHYTNPEISELESAVKFLQESEEQTMISPIVVSQKMKEKNIQNLTDQTKTFFIAEEITSENSSEIISGIDSVVEDSIAISEAEIITEAAKLESERKAKLTEENIEIESTSSNLPITDLFIENPAKKRKDSLEYFPKPLDVPPDSADHNSTLSDSLFKTSVLEERLKEPPKIVIPNTDTLKICDSFFSSKSSLLIQKDTKQNIYQKVESSNKSSEKPDISKKDLEKLDSENIGSPRIILKIAKSAITDCTEPKSPKSPKLRSATNSPNPDDSPGQKLGKIKLKVSKSGHLSIVSNENLEEISHRYTENSTSTLSPIGMKIKLSKTGEASVVQSEFVEDDVQTEQKSEENKKSECSIGMKIKLSKSGDATIVVPDSKEILPKFKEKSEVTSDVSKKGESSLGMKIKLSKTGDVSIVQSDKQEFIQECIKRTESPLGMKIKLSKSGDASIVSSDCFEEVKATCNLSDKKDTLLEVDKHTSESPVGKRFKLSKTKCGSSIVSIDNVEEELEKLDIPDHSKSMESPFGMKIKLSKTGDPSIVYQENPNDVCELVKQKEKLENPSSLSSKHSDPIGMTIKVSKSGEATILHCKSVDQSNIQAEKIDFLEEFKAQECHLEKLKKNESLIGMKIKLTKTGDASIVQPETISEIESVNHDSSKREKEQNLEVQFSPNLKVKQVKVKDASTVDTEKKEKQKNIKEAVKRIEEHSLEMKIKLSKTGHPTIVPSESHSDSTFNQSKEMSDLLYKFNIIKGEGQIEKKQCFSDYTSIPDTFNSCSIQDKESQVLDESSLLQSQKREIEKEISHKRKDVILPSTESKKLRFESKLSEFLPELTIQPLAVKEQKRVILESNSAISHEQINAICQEVSITQVKIQENLELGLANIITNEKVLSKVASSSPVSSDCEIIEHRPELVFVNENSNSSQDVVIIEEVPPVRLPEVKIPKKRGRPRRIDTSSRFVEPIQIIVPRDPLELDEALPPPHEPKESERPRRTCRNQKSYAPPKRGRGGRGRGKRKLDNAVMSPHKKFKIDQDLTAIEKAAMRVITIKDSPAKIDKLKQVQSEILASTSVTLIKHTSLDLTDDTEGVVVLKTNKKELSTLNDNDKNTTVTDHQNWLTPTSKKTSETVTRNESISTIQVIDEETRMSAESGSRSQTPARNITAVSETVINEESQGSVLSTATTESERVKVKNRRMEINFDPDEGSFTVDKIAEYEWPIDKKGETFMVQEQISQYLGVKSFKRKYPDLKRRIVDMEERNYLRENGLVSEAMCDMGLTSLCSSEVLDVMCSDFPDQYEEYRKHMREKQVKEHSKKQKELTAAANAERNRIDLAEMAVQSALSWNINLNKARMDNRKSSLDLQTFTIHLPKKEQKLEDSKNCSYYPVALIPGQYTDYYREYTPAELRYYPLNTVLYGPMKPNEHKFDSQSEGSQSDSDSDSSSDDSSSSCSDGTQGTEASQSTMDDVDMELILQKNDGKSVKLIC